jgi:hypothetical protein
VRLLVAGKHIFRPFPWHQEIEASEILGKRHGLVNDALLGLGIAKLDMAGEREVLALRMAREAVVGKDPPQVGVAAERDPVHVEHLALEPAGDRPQPGHARHRSRLVGGDVDANAMIPGQRQQAIDDLEPLRPVGVVDPRNLHQLLVLVSVAK